MRFGVVSSWGGAASNVFLQVAFLDEELILFLELVEIFCMVTFDLMKFTPPVRFRSRDIRLEGWWKSNIMCVEDLKLYLLTKSIRKYKVLCRPLALLEGRNIPDMRDVMANA